MGKLRHVAPLLGSLRPRIAPQADADGHSPTAEPWRLWYKLARWARLRMRVFARDLFTCQWPGCGRVEGDTSKLVADHIEPHRGDPVLFWSEANLQTLCKPCHDSKKQAAERRSRRFEAGGGSKL